MDKFGVSLLMGGFLDFEPYLLEKAGQTQKFDSVDEAINAIKIHAEPLKQSDLIYHIVPIDDYDHCGPVVEFYTPGYFQRANL